MKERMVFVAKMAAHLTGVYALFMAVFALLQGWPPYWWDIRTWGGFALLYGAYVLLAGGYAGSVIAHTFGWRNMNDCVAVMLESARVPVVDEDGRCLGCDTHALEDAGFNPNDVGSSPDPDHHTHDCSYRKAVLWCQVNGYSRCANCYGWEGDHGVTCMYPPGWKGPTSPSPFKE